MVWSVFKTISARVPCHTSALLAMTVLLDSNIRVAQPIWECNKESWRPRNRLDDIPHAVDTVCHGYRIPGLAEAHGLRCDTRPGSRPEFLSRHTGSSPFE